MMGKRCLVSGWVKTFRKQGKIGFVSVNDGFHEVNL